MATKKKMLQAAAGNATGGAGLDITDVFSTYLYTGNGATQTITNDIDLAGEGGLVWVKDRTGTRWHVLTDSERGVGSTLFSNDARAEELYDHVTSLNSDGFGVKAVEINGSGQKYASWTFRKAPKFFTCLTYSGTGPGSGANEQQVSHDLGAKPGIVIIKRTDSTGDWWVFTDVIDGSNDYGYLNQTGAFGNSANNVATDSVFNVGGTLNTSGASYVAYLFANNDGDGEFGPDGDQDIIKCGSYTGNGADARTIGLGFEAQWVLLKRSDGATDWWILDNMRGLPARPEASQYLEANTANAEAVTGQVFGDNQGFMVDAGDYNTSGENYIYMAIRRGPLAQPESATEVFDIADMSSFVNTHIVNITPDAALLPWRTTSYDDGTNAYPEMFDRLRGKGGLQTPNDRAENTGRTGAWDYMDRFTGVYATGGYMWKRAPGYFDVVAATGLGGDSSYKHSLGVVPEMMWYKKRDGVSDWWVYHKDLGNTQYLLLNSTAGANNGTIWQSTTPTDDTYYIGGGNSMSNFGVNFMNYLFATVPGVSKVGSYTGNGSSQTIDCGFTSGARFVLIKRTDSTGDWYVWDTERGIVAGNDPYLELNTTDAEVTSTDWVDPDNSGFIVNGTTINASSAEYIFYAVS